MLAFSWLPVVVGQVRDSDITAEVVEQLKQAGPKISGIIEANGEGDAGMLEALFKVKEGFGFVFFAVSSRLFRGLSVSLASLPAFFGERYLSYLHLCSVLWCCLLCGVLGAAVLSGSSSSD